MLPPESSASRQSFPGRDCAWLFVVWPRRPSFMHWVRKRCEVKALAKTWVCQESLIYKMKTEAVKSVDLNKL